jgi:hypothetical protein
VKNVIKVSRQASQLSRTYIYHTSKNYPQTSQKFVSGPNPVLGVRIAYISEPLMVVVFSSRPPSSTLIWREKRTKTDLSTHLSSQAPLGRTSKDPRRTAFGITCES